VFVDFWNVLIIAFSIGRLDRGFAKSNAFSDQDIVCRMIAVIAKIVLGHFYRKRPFT